MIHTVRTYIHTYGVGALIITLLLIPIVIGGYLYSSRIEQKRAYHGSFSITGNTLTITTAPVKTLPEHVHEADDQGVDSVLAPGHGVFVSSDHFTVPFDMWITGVNASVQNGPYALLHHATLYRNDRKNPLCPDRDAEIRTVGADSPSLVSFSEPFGMFVKKGTELYVQGMLHNPAPPRGPGGAYSKVAIGFTLTFVRNGEGRTKPIAFYRFFLRDIEYCADPSSITDRTPDVFTVPPSVTRFVKDAEEGPIGNTARFTFTESGTILGTGGHLHPEDGGTDLEMFLNNTRIDSFVPKHAGTTTWEWITPPRPASIPVRAGDQIRIRATYTNPYPFPISDAMGHGAVLFAPDDTSALLK